MWEKVNAPRFDNLMLKTKTVGAEAKPDGIYVKFEGEKSACRSRSAMTWCWSPSAARRTAKKIAADKAASPVTDRGFINDKQMRTTCPHIFAIGDIVGNRCSRTRPCTRPRRGWERRMAKACFERVRS